MMPEASATHLREPANMMRLKRLGSLHQSRLSFMRILTRRMARERWQFTRRSFEIDKNGVGQAVYTASGPRRAYSLVAFAHDIPDEARSDRVIAELWDTTYCLFDGIPTAEDVARLAANVPRQEAGQLSEKELTLSRANRSVRLWAHVVEALESGTQPDPEQIDQVGYLMRTTAVYGSGKFGAADREQIENREEMHAPFQAEMLTVFLIRAFVKDLVEHQAQSRGGASAVQLDADLARRLGIGNSTGLGMAPFLINHPVLFNNWMTSREAAIAEVRAIKYATPAEVDFFQELLQKSHLSVTRWHTAHPLQQVKLTELKSDLKALSVAVEEGDWQSDFPWNRLMIWSESALHEEGQELLASLILEPYGHMVDEFAIGMSDKSQYAGCIVGSMPISQVRALIERDFGWALELDWSAQAHCARAWYVSEEKLEPRLAERFQEPVADYEQPLAPARDAAAAHLALTDWDEDAPIAEFLLQHPEHRHTIRRAQLCNDAPYGEIRDNTIGESLLPIDLLRAKLSFFGATHFDPRSDRWVRICMYAGAPYPQELSNDNADLWVYPVSHR